MAPPPPPLAARRPPCISARRELRPPPPRPSPAEEAPRDATPPSNGAAAPPRTPRMPHNWRSCTGKSPSWGNFLPSYRIKFMCSLVDACSSTVFCSASSTPSPPSRSPPFAAGEIRVNFCADRSSMTSSSTRKQLAIVSIAKPSAHTHLCAPTFCPRSLTRRRSASRESTPFMKWKPSARCVCSNVYNWKVSSVICCATSSRCCATA
mmetsp:Transcript_2870/g.6501  ORF Transcript_2870/g.6501 Transcript_2870/m.6501 type:complete len:207 (-) Transcript_2870:235-855(-)